MRPEIDVGTETRDRVRQYAKRNNLAMPGAWADVVEAGLAELEEDNHD